MFSNRHALDARDKVVRIWKRYLHCLRMLTKYSSTLWNVRNKIRSFLLSKRGHWRPVQVSGDALDKVQQSEHNPHVRRWWGVNRQLRSQAQSVRLQSCRARQWMSRSPSFNVTQPVKSRTRWGIIYISKSPDHFGTIRNVPFLFLF